MKEIEKDKENNKENYLISIVGEQMLDGETDKIEVLTAGNFMKKKDHYYIGYKEYDEDNPETFFNNLIKVEDDTVTINRCIYQTVAGDLSIGVFTKTLENRLTEKGGVLEVSYTLDFNTDLVSENRFVIKIEEKQ